MKKLLTGGRIVTGAGLIQGDVLLNGELVEAVGSGLSRQDARIVDVSGMLLLPGAIDAHTHFDLDVCNTTTADDFATGSQAALLGGTTAFIDFACPNKGETLSSGLSAWHQKAAGKTACDYGFHMTIDDWNKEIRKELPEMFRQGITSFKMYMTYPAMLLPDRELFEALRLVGSMGGVVGVHCENAGLIDALQVEAVTNGETSPATHPKTRPDIAEAEAISRLLKLAKAANTPVVIVHLSSAAGLQEVKNARAAGQKVWVETCPQYLLLDDSRYSEPDFRGARYVCAPPLRKMADRQALWRALTEGDVQTVSTDHCSFTLKQKEAGRADFRLIPGGMPGVETRLLGLYSEGVRTGRITLERMVQLLSENPARLYGLWGQKGAIAPGFHGDIVVLDPSGTTPIRDDTTASAAGYAPLHGMELLGSIRQVYLRGQLAVENGQLLERSHGRYLHRERGGL